MRHNLSWSVVVTHMATLLALHDLETTVCWDDDDGGAEIWFCGYNDGRRASLVSVIVKQLFGHGDVDFDFGLTFWDWLCNNNIVGQAGDAL